MLKIIGEVNDLIENYETQSLERVNGLRFSQYQTIRMTEFYSSSQYLNGQNDELDKEKPFLQIGNGICDVEDAATDIDTKDLQISSDEPAHFDKSFLLSKELQNWMKPSEANFGKVMNELRSTKTRYGGVIAKKCYEYDDSNKKVLRIEVPEWKNLVTDPLDIENGVIIEKHYMSPAELSRKQDVWDNVKEAMKMASKSRSTDQLVEEEATSKRIPVYEVRGEFTQEFWKDAKSQRIHPRDKHKYSYQLYIIAGEAGKQVILYMEDDTEKVYKYLARKKKSGRSLGIGVIEEAEQAQVWTNDAVQKQQRIMEYTSKFVGQTASKKLKGRNMLTEAENGLLLEHDDGKPITRVDMSPSQGMQQFEQYMSIWYQQLEKVSSAYAAQRGETPPSGTPFRLQATILQQSSSVFDTIREEFGIFLSEVFYDWILPYLSSRLNKAHILAYEFSPDELKTLDKSYSLHDANNKVIEMILSGKLVTAEEYDMAQKLALEQIELTKTHRFMDVPKDYYKDLEPKISFVTTGEQRNKAAMLESLTSILTLVGANPTILQDPVLSQVFIRLVEISGAGISPVTLMAGIQEQAKQMQATQEAAQQGKGPVQPQPQGAPQPVVPEPSLQANPV